MGYYEHAVDVHRPIRVVYDQWTQFESYPEFLHHVDSVEQTAVDMTHWRVHIAGIEREYDARILEQTPDEVIAWMSVDGPEQGGRVTFTRLDADRTRVMLRLDFDPHGISERAGDALGFVESSVRRSAEEFKHFLEDRVSATGGWRGEISEGKLVHDGGSAGVALPADQPTGRPVDYGPASADLDDLDLRDRAQRSSDRRV